jgi:hypothetical protein
MSVAPTTVTRVRRAAATEVLLGVLIAIVLGFVLGFASEAYGADPEDPGLAIVEARVLLDDGVSEVSERSKEARAAGDEALASCIGERVLVLKGAQRALLNSEDDYALARMRGDEQASQLALRRAGTAEHAGKTLLAEARGCATEAAILGRANGVTVLKVKRPKTREDKGFGTPKRTRPGKR